MTDVDITADLNAEDQTGYVWTFLDEARDPSIIVPGELVVAGDARRSAIQVGACHMAAASTWRGSTATRSTS
jgi:hypothetical protein